MLDAMSLSIIIARFQTSPLVQILEETPECMALQFNYEGVSIMPPLN